MRRLVLFDVDGTLLSSGPAGLRVFAEALQEVFGTSGNMAAYRFEGKLDPVIVGELMREAGVPEETIAERRALALARYLDRLEETLRAHRPTLKPGVLPLVESVAAEPWAVSALLTGNVERGARIKLSAAGLWHLFAFGVFGDEAARRVDLGPMALERARRVTGISFSGADCVVVGDSRSDVECGQALGARVVAVATGRTPAEELRKAGAYVVLPDFSDLTAAREAILGV